mmetsp:Transcript_2919/g.8802  ORF Transcript_2919/g.8802 Transcript_2919/m.8802 type:complete len:243 (-) Transcript_2919:780-1508(-)
MLAVPVRWPHSIGVIELVHKDAAITSVVLQGPVRAKRAKRKEHVRPRPGDHVDREWCDRVPLALGRASEAERERATRRVHCRCVTEGEFIPRSGGTVRLNSKQRHHLGGGRPSPPRQRRCNGHVGHRRECGRKAHSEVAAMWRARHNCRDSDRQCVGRFFRHDPTQRQTNEGLHHDTDAVARAVWLRGRPVGAVGAEGSRRHSTSAHVDCSGCRRIASWHVPFLVASTASSGARSAAITHVG